jgi:hypothetical protein
MQFVNPIEILKLSGITDTSSIDNETIKKAKRKLFADIELSDSGNFEYWGIQLSKGSCEKVIDELTDNKEAKEFYLYIANNQPLTKFLVNGNTEIFKNFKQDSIFKVKEFVNFISPYFSVKFDKALLDAFVDDNTDLTKKIISTSFLITTTDQNVAFKSVSNNIQNNITEIDEITTDIKNEESVYDEEDIDKVVQLIKEYFPSSTINSLPQYFQSQILKVANSINYLNIAIWDNFDNPQVCQDLLSYILTLNIDGLNKPTFQKNYEIVKKKNQERNEEERNRPILLKYASYVIEVKNKIKEIENKSLSPNALLSWINSTININEINNLPDSFDEIKNMVGLSMRAMSVAVWNSYSNIDIALELTEKGLQIKKLKIDANEKLLSGKKELTEIKNRLKPINVPKTSKVSSVDSESSDTINGYFIFFIIIVIIAVLFSIFGGSKKSTTYDNQSTPTYTSSNDEEIISDTLAAPTEYREPIRESEYLGNQLNNGSSPLDNCFGKGLYGGNASLTIDNGSNTDAIVCLYNIETGQTIRNEYVQKNSKFKISYIEEGNYKIRVFYGNDWNPYAQNECGTNGNFENDISFSEFDDAQYFESNYNGYSEFTATLSPSVGGNATTSGLSQSSFFNQ